MLHTVLLYFAVHSIHISIHGTALLISSIVKTTYLIANQPFPTPDQTPFLYPTPCFFHLNLPQAPPSFKCLLCYVTMRQHVRDVSCSLTLQPVSQNTVQIFLATPTKSVKEKHIPFFQVAKVSHQIKSNFLSFLPPNWHELPSNLLLLPCQVSNQSVEEFSNYKL